MTLSADKQKEKVETIDLLCFLSGKEEWWYANMTIEELLKEYDRLNAIYK